MEANQEIKIEKCEKVIPDLPLNPVEVLTGGGGISLKGGGESTFKVLTSFVGKAFKKAAQGSTSFMKKEIVDNLEKNKKIIFPYPTI